MIVKRHMLPKAQLAMVTTETPIKEALALLEEKGYLSLPVMNADNAGLAGAIYKANIYEEAFNSALSKDDFMAQTVGIVYTPTSLSIQENSNLEDAAKLMTDAQQSFIPVYGGEDFVGILTHTAIFEAYSKLLGVNRGTRLSLTTHDMKGRLATLSAIVSDLGGNVIAFAIQDALVMGMARLVLRVENCDISELTRTVERKGFQVERID